MTAIDKFSKYAQVKILKSRAVEDVMEPVREIIISFGIPEIVVIDNEKALISKSIIFMLENQYNVKVFKIHPYSSNVNGQIERFHSTLSELMRCFKTENVHKTFSELLHRSVYEYNNSIHSTIQRKPIEEMKLQKKNSKKNIWTTGTIITKINAKQRLTIQDRPFSCKKIRD